MPTDRHDQLTDTLSDRSEADLRARLEEQEVEPYAVEQAVWLLSYARQHSLSIKALAKRVKCSGSVLSQVFNARYPGNYTLRARLFERFRNEEANRELFGGRDDFVKTRIAESLWTIFEKTRYARRIQIIQSPEQLGKSRAALEYTHANNGGHTIMTTLKPGCTSNPTGIFLRDLAIAAGVRSNVGRKIIDVRYDVHDALEVCDLVIVDEFHQVEHWPDRAVRDILDYIRIELFADGQRGVVLIATNSDVLSLLQTFRKRTRYNLGQLLGRMCNEVLDIAPDEVPVEDVRLLVERYFKPRKSTVEKLHDLATRPRIGHFGLILDILNRAWTECKVQRQSLSDEIVLKIAADTMEDINAKQQLYA